MAAADSREVQALRNLHELMTSVNSADQVTDLLHAVALGVVDIIGFQVAVIYVLDAHDVLEVVAVAGEGEGVREAMMGRRVHLGELSEEFEIADHWGGLRFVPHERLPADATSSWIPDFEPMDLPDAWHPLDALYALLHDPAGRLLGVLAVDLPHDRRRPGVLGRQVLEMYAVQAGLAIHHAQTRARLLEQVALGETTRRIAAAPASWLDARSVLEHAMEPLVDNYGCDRLVVMLLQDTEDPRAEVVATCPPSLAERLGPADLVCLEELARGAWEKQVAVVVADLGDTSAGIIDPTRREHLVGLVERLGGGHVLATPLGSGSEVFGCVILLRHAASMTWRPVESEAARGLGAEVGRSMLHERLHAAERRLNVELQELDRHKNELMGTITHELKAPLTVIDGHVELLEESPARTESVRAIRRGTDRLQDLVADLLLLSRVRDPHVPLERVPVDLAELVGEIEELFSVEAQRRSLTLECPDGLTPVEAWGSREELSRALTNVVGNAVKFTPAGGRVTLGVSRDAGTAVFTCTDTGIGIDQGDLTLLFEEFNRSSNPEAQAVPGSGLGLAIVKRIVERHDGTVTVTSRRGSGSSFRIALPVPAGRAF